MNHINLQLSNINITSIFYYITSIFNDINFDIVLTIFLIINTLLAFSIVFSRVSNYYIILGMDISIILNTLPRFYPLFNIWTTYI